MRKKVFIITIIVIGIPVAFFFFVGVFQPVATSLLGNNRGDRVNGLAYYHDGSYLKYECGEAFRTFLSDYDATTEGRAVDFWYEDFSYCDNLLYGRHYDIYIADFVFSEDEYEALNSRVTGICNSTSFTQDSYCAYILPSTAESEKYTCFKMIALCKEKQIARYIMLGDWDPAESDEKAIEVILDCHYLDWDPSENVDDLAPTTPITS